jgi:hypothetical protein
MMTAKQWCSKCMSKATNKPAPIHDAVLYVAIAKQRHGKQVSAAKNGRTTVREPMELMSSTQSMPRIYKEDWQQQLCY